MVRSAKTDYDFDAAIGDTRGNMVRNCLPSERWPSVFKGFHAKEPLSRKFGCNAPAMCFQASESVERKLVPVCLQVAKLYGAYIELEEQGHVLRKGAVRWGTKAVASGAIPLKPIGPFDPP